MSATSPTFEDRIREVVAAENFGTPSAAKRGRNPKWPYVPVVVHGPAYHGGQEQIRGKAFATREEALDYAAGSIERARQKLARDLANPTHRAQREHYGLPREVPGAIFQRVLSQEPPR